MISAQWNICLVSLYYNLENQSDVALPNSFFTVQKQNTWIFHNPATTVPMSFLINILFLFYERWQFNWFHHLRVNFHLALSSTLQLSLLLRSSLYPTLSTTKFCSLTCQKTFLILHKTQLNSHLPHLSIWSCQVTPSLKPSTSVTSNLSFLSSPSKL